MEWEIRMRVNEPKFTKGPWAVYGSKGPDNTGGYDCAIVDVDNNIIAETFGHVGRIGDDIQKRPALENANLIAAAPELYEALENLMKMVPVQERDHPAYSQARKILAKARGEQS